ncbi:MAG: hypothetical protein M1827_007110 [Pycnora praestabilis]|nr:MAG: hypothetical protein M1827_007110 [Pycnora praestabilis]
MFRILEAQAPAKQTATDTISTLSSRLTNGTLLEDRRAAILGLRSFAKEYPASVASGALRGLISSLNKDAEDVDTIKVVLETLLMLFNPNETSPEASEDIALWLADEFTQRQDNITVLLDLLDTNDFYSRLYSLQLISAISTARPGRTQECILTAPLGIARLVTTLDERRDAVRNEGLLLLNSLTPSSPELQKLVAFENAFDRIFALIKIEGSLKHGGIVVQDCLSLLANLLRLNVSNQSYFRETGCVPKVAKLLADVVKEQETDEGVAEWARSQRDKNLWGLLAVLRLFLVRGTMGTQANQLSFWQSGVLLQVLHLAFSKCTENTIRAEALTTCADLIRSHADLQEKFAHLEVTPMIDKTQTTQVDIKSHQNGVSQVYVIDGLLGLALDVSSPAAFDARLAACECIKAYCFSHEQNQINFLGRAISGYTAGQDSTPNVITTLIGDPQGARTSDPYRLWLAAVLVLHLLYENYAAKALLMNVAEGDASHGEEVITCIQALTGKLIAGLQKGEDERVSIGYLMLLCAWLFEEPDAVNDFLGEGSSVQSLLQVVTQGSNNSVLVQGLCAALLGIIYEFSTKDSPIPRAVLHPLLVSQMGRERYIDTVTRLREHPLLRDFEVLPQGLVSGQTSGLPDVYFDKTFVAFLKDNFSRLLRAIDRDPGMEIPIVANGIQRGISRELVDSLRTQLSDKSQALQKSESELLSLERRLDQEQANHRRSKETATAELNRIKSINKGLQKHHEDDVNQIHSNHQAMIEQMREQHREEVSALTAQMRQSQEEAANSATQIRERNDAEVIDLRRIIQTLQIDLKKAGKEHLQDLEIAHEEYCSKVSTLEFRSKRAEERFEEAEIRAARAAQLFKTNSAKAAEHEEALQRKEEARKVAQTELDDLLMVLGDLEEKRIRDRQRLKTLGEEVSDAEEAGSVYSGEDDVEDGHINT